MATGARAGAAPERVLGVEGDESAAVGGERGVDDERVVPQSGHAVDEDVGLRGGGGGGPDGEAVAVHDKARRRARRSQGVGGDQARAAHAGVRRRHVHDGLGQLPLEARNLGQVGRGNGCRPYSPNVSTCNTNE